MAFSSNSIHRQLFDRGYMQRDLTAGTYPDGSSYVRKEQMEAPRWFKDKARGKPYRFYKTEIAHPEFKEAIPIVVGAIGPTENEEHHVIGVLSPRLGDPLFKGLCNPHYRLTFKGRLSLQIALVAASVRHIDSPGKPYRRLRKGSNPLSKN